MTKYLQKNSTFFHKQIDQYNFGHLGNLCSAFFVCVIPKEQGLVIKKTSRVGILWRKRTRYRNKEEDSFVPQKTHGLSITKSIYSDSISLFLSI